MVLIPPGMYYMGPGEGGQLTTLLKPMWVGKEEMTQAVYAAVTGKPVPKDKGYGQESQELRPMHTVTHNEAVAFTARLVSVTGKPFRLPTEAEWEYAYRAGTRTKFHDGESYPGKIAVTGGTDIYTEPMNVRTKKANAFGLHDMAGNVAEWCDPRPAKGKAACLYCGGSFLDPNDECRADSRKRGEEPLATVAIGFRVCVPIDPTPVSGRPGYPRGKFAVDGPGMPPAFALFSLRGRALRDELKLTDAQRKTLDLAEAEAGTVIERVLADAQRKFIHERGWDKLEKTPEQDKAINDILLALQGKVDKELSPEQVNALIEVRSRKELP